MGLGLLFMLVMGVFFFFYGNNVGCMSGDFLVFVVLLLFRFGGLLLFMVGLSGLSEGGYILLFRWSVFGFGIVFRIGIGLLFWLGFGLGFFGF